MNRIYAILSGIGIAILAIFTAFSKGRKSATTEIKAETEAKARETEKLGMDAMIGGLNREQEVKDEIIDVDDRNHFG